MSYTATASLDLIVTDVTGQKSHRATGVPSGSTVREFVQNLLAKLGLSPNDAQGRPLNYSPRLERTGRLLNGSEILGEAVRPHDRIKMMPSIDAGAR